MLPQRTADRAVVRDPLDPEDGECHAVLIQVVHGLYLFDRPVSPTLVIRTGHWTILFDSENEHEPPRF